MTPRQIRRVFPDLEPDAVRVALLQAAELMRNEDSSLRPADDAVGAIVSKAQRTAGMSEEDAAELAVTETRAARLERARPTRSSE
jgi:hypothetical protein